MPARRSSARASFRPAIRSGEAQSKNFPAEGPIHVLVGVSAPGQNWSEQRAQGVMNFMEDYKKANPDREVTVERIDSGTDLAVVSDRIGAYLNAHPETTAYFDTGYWHAGVARVLADRGVEPGKVLLGGFDLVPEVMQQMKAGYVQVQIDQQPYEQGFMPVMEVYLAKNVGLAPADIDTGRASSRRTRSIPSWSLRPRACAKLALRRAGARPARHSDEPPCRKGRLDATLLKIYLEKPELAGLVLLVVLAVIFHFRSNGVFLSPENLRGVLGLLPEVGLVAIGVTILMICGEFDLSVGSVFALMPMAFAIMLECRRALRAASIARPRHRRRRRVHERLRDGQVRHRASSRRSDAVHGALL